MTKLTKAEREELPARIQAAIATVCSGMAAMSIPANPRDVDLVLADCAKALADLDAAEAERDELRQIAEGCCNATDGGCSPGVSIEFLRGVPKEVGRIRAQRDRAESELDAERKMRVEAEAAAARAESELATMRADLKAKLADAELDRDSFRESFVRVLDAVGCGNIFVSDEALVAGVREKMAELDATKEKLADAERFASDLADDRRKLNSIRDDLCLVGKEMTELRKERDDAKAKLAALVSVVATWQEWGGHCETCEFVRQRAANPGMDVSLFADYCDCGWHAAKGAIAAARVTK